MDTGGMIMAGKNRGFTFTISAVMICATLIALSVIAWDWRNTHEAALTRVLPSWEGMRMENRAGADLAEIYGASAKVERNSSSVFLTVAATFPFKKEGAALALPGEYARGIRNALLGNSPYEAALQAAVAGGSEQAVLGLPDSGEVRHSNEGSNGTDFALLRHPLGWRQASVDVAISCGKYASSVSPLVSQGSGSTYNVSYRVIHYSPDGNNSTSTISADASSAVSYSVSYSDGGVLSFSSNLSARNTSVSYTKSPSARLVLPFDLEVNSTANGAVRDYSIYGNDVTLGGGDAAHAPAWVADCRAGGCYRFDGVDDFATARNLNITDGAVAFYGSELLLNRDLENMVGNPPCDDGSTDNWDNWVEITNALEGRVYFDCSASVQSGSRSVRIYYDGTAALTTERIYQQVTVTQGTPYKLAFWTKGDGTGSAWYYVRDMTTGRYLQSDGSWGATETRFDSGITANSYQRVERSLAVPSGSTLLEIGFTPYGTGAAPGTPRLYYVDNASLSEGIGMNGGFEYYTEAGDQDLFRNWAISGDAYFNADSGARSGGVALLMEHHASSTSYMGSSSLILQNNVEYSLEFWAKKDGGHSTETMDYQVYDSGNAKYLNSSGGWQTASATLSAQLTDYYNKTVRNFRTLGSGVGSVEVRLYAPSNSAMDFYVDDVSLTAVYDFSVAAWVKASPAANAAVISQINESSPTSQRGFDIFVDGSSTKIWLASDNQTILAQLPSIADGTWHYVGLSVNRTGNYSAYLDGALAASGAFSIGTVNYTGLFRIGGGSPSFLHGSGYFAGMVDEVRVYRRALSASQMREHYYGRYQEGCVVETSVEYNGSALAGRKLEAAYPASLRVRQMPSGAVLLMPFDMNESGEEIGAVLDYSPYRLDGTIHNSSRMAWVNDGVFGGAYRFNDGGYIRTAGNVMNFGSGQFTLSFWLNGTAGTGQAVIAKDGGEGSDSGILLRATGNTLYYNDGASDLAVGTFSNWTHFAIVRNGTGAGELAFYVNGALSSSNADARSIGNALPFTIGASSATPGTDALSGVALDELRVFSRALSQDEVQALYSDRQLLKSGAIAASVG